jgi:hypothetical protein
MRLDLHARIHHLLVKGMAVFAGDLHHDRFGHFIAGDNTSHTTTIVH